MKKKIIVAFFLICCLCQLNYNMTTTAAEFLDHLDNTYKLSQEDLDKQKEKLKMNFHYIHAFEEISENPPEVEGYPNYFNKLIMMQKIEQIEAETQYEFYRQIRLIIGEIKDYHLDYTGNESLPITNTLQKSFFYTPIILTIKGEKQHIYVYGDPVTQDFLKTFDSKTQQTVLNNKNYRIKSINGQEPFAYIQNFCHSYSATKNLHGSFTLSYWLQQNPILFKCPLSKEEVGNGFTVKYENDNSFKTDYMAFSVDPIANDIFNLKRQNDKFKNEDFIKFCKKYFDSSEYIQKIKSLEILTLRDLQKLYNKNKQSLNSEKLKLVDKINEDYIYYENKMRCWVDDRYGYNIIYINSFMVEFKTIEDFFKQLQIYEIKIKECFTLFDKNKYPIIYFSQFNGGGLLRIAHFFIELLSPLFSFNFYGSIRKESAENIEDIAEFINPYSKDKCKLMSKKEIQSHYINVDYGNGIYSSITDTFLLEPQDKKAISDFKKTLKNKRKPHEIIIFTDGFSFSAGSIAIKNIQYAGAGLVVGYLGNILEKNFVMDSSQSGSAIFKNNLITIPICGIYLNKTITNKTFPLEYTVHNVDRRLHYYSFIDFDDFDSYKSIFYEEASQAISLFTIKCDVYRKDLLFITERCDEELRRLDPHSHGGYECGTDGRWTSKCIPSYCDDGYFFDHELKKCVVDPCLS